MTVYMIIDIEILVRELYDHYVDQVAAIVEQHAGRYLVRGGRVTVVAGDWAPDRIIVIRFPSMEALKRCFASSEYLVLAPLRERSTRSRAIIVEGYAPSL